MMLQLFVARVIIIFISVIGTIGFVDADADFDGFVGREVVFLHVVFLRRLFLNYVE